MRGEKSPFHQQQRCMEAQTLALSSRLSRPAVEPERSVVGGPAVSLLVLPQNRHPERSAAQIDRVTQPLWRGVEGPRRVLI